MRANRWLEPADSSLVILPPLAHLSTNLFAIANDRLSLYVSLTCRSVSLRGIELVRRQTFAKLWMSKICVGSGICRGVTAC
eukprot:768576-Hanusia_phi.AAC.9